MTNPRPKQLSTFDDSFVTSGGEPSENSVIRAGSNIAVLFENLVPQIVGGRLTIDDSNFEPIPESDLTAKTNLYYVPFNGVDISVFDGSEWVSHDFFPMLSVDNSGLIADRNYDVFVHIVNDQPQLGLIAWNAGVAGSGSRATALDLQDGIYVLSTDFTWRYIGTVRTTSSSEFEDSNRRKFVWNAYNRVERVSVAKPNANFISGVTTTAWATAFGNAALDIEFVIGLPTDVRIDLVASVEENANSRDSLNRATCAIDTLNSVGAVDFPVYYLDDSTSLWGHIGAWISTPDYYVAIASFQMMIAGSVEFRTNDSFSPGGYILVVLG